MKKGIEYRPQSHRNGRTENHQLKYNNRLTKQCGTHEDKPQSRVEKQLNPHSLLGLCTFFAIIPTPTPTKPILQDYSSCPVAAT